MHRINRLEIGTTYNCLGARLAGSILKTSSEQQQQQWQKIQLALAAACFNEQKIHSFLITELVREKWLCAIPWDGVSSLTGSM